MSKAKKKSAHGKDHHIGPLPRRIRRVARRG
jgi:hypothetical protein